MSKKGLGPRAQRRADAEYRKTDAARRLANRERKAANADPNAGVDEDAA